MSVAFKTPQGYRPLNQQLFDHNDAEYVRKFPVRTKIKLKSQDIPAFLRWLKEQGSEFQWQSWQGSLYIYLTDHKVAMMMKLTWQK